MANDTISSILLCKILTLHELYQFNKIGFTKGSCIILVENDNIFISFKYKTENS